MKGNFKNNRKLKDYFIALSGYPFPPQCLAGVPRTLPAREFVNFACSTHE
jgi:hypothetical protein